MTLLDETVFYTILFNEQIWITGVFLWIKDPDPVFSQIQIRVTQKDRIRIRNTAYWGSIITCIIIYSFSNS